MSCERCGSETTRVRLCRECALLESVENEAAHRDAPPLYECSQCGEDRAESPDSVCWLCRSDRHEQGDDGSPQLISDGGSAESSVTTDQDLPDGWVREEIVGGMDTVGDWGLAEEYPGMGSGMKCRHCEHFVPIDAVEGENCPTCGNPMIGTVIMGMQDVTALYPEGWFDAE